jgi:ribose/xylose/arabinose/galactoside ABC-type transport system permease subunit
MVMEAASLFTRVRNNSSFEARSTFKIFLIFIGMIVVATVVSEGVFLQPNNLVNLGFQNTILALVALGQLLVILTGGIDLSAGAIVAMSSVVIVLGQEFGMAGSLALALAVAVVIGLLSGSLVAFARLPSFVVTLGMMQVVYSLAKVASGGGTVYTGFDGAQQAPALQSFYEGTFLGIPLPILTAGLALIAVALYLRTSIGHYVYAVGGNQKAAFLSGLPVKRVVIMVYALAGLLAGLGGFLFVARVGLGDPQTGPWLALDSIAAVSIGGASLAGGVGNVVGTLIGVFILSVLNNIMNLMGVPPTVQPAVKGLVILIAVYLNTRK